MWINAKQRSIILEAIEFCKLLYLFSKEATNQINLTPDKLYHP